MVCLHGLGDNSANYRNALMSFGWATDFPNTIFVCPEAATTTSDYYQSPGDESIVDTCIRFAMSNYHIDSADVILQGFSLGGRAALRYGLDNYTKFKALLLNTPAVQGVKNALNGQPSYLYTYTNASNIPIYITHGDLDIFYEPPIDSAIKQIILNDGIVRYNDVPNMAHAIPAFSKMSDALQFFNAPAHAGNDVELFELDAPARIFSSSIPSQALIQNVGNDTVTSVDFQMTQGLMPGYYYSWTGRLLPFQHALVTLPATFIESGTLENSLVVKIDTINGLTDTFTSNNEKIDTFQLISQGDVLPFNEGFEEAQFPPPGWLLQQAGDIFSPWFQDTVRKSGAFSAGAFNSIFYFDNEGRAEGLLSPVVDLTSMPNPQLSFDVAYNYIRYTPPYFTSTVDFTDTLDILISTDGGANYTSLFRKYGADLATFAEPNLNPLSAQAVIIAPQDSNWRHYTIDLSNYSTAPEAFIKFNYISGLGGSIYLDNVNVSAPLSVKVVTPVSYNIYPNPAVDRVMVVGDPENQIQITVQDITGRDVLSGEGRTNASGEFLLDTHTLTAGIYLVRTTTGQTVSATKLVIQR
jgi:predicted esterase